VTPRSLNQSRRISDPSVKAESRRVSRQVPWRRVRGPGLGPGPPSGWACGEGVNRGYREPGGRARHPAAPTCGPPFQIARRCCAMETASGDPGLRHSSRVPGEGMRAHWAGVPSPPPGPHPRTPTPMGPLLLSPPVGPHRFCISSLPGDSESDTAGSPSPCRIFLSSTAHGGTRARAPRGATNRARLRPRSWLWRATVARLKPRSRPLATG
jgi:hypothetical protein